MRLLHLMVFVLGVLDLQAQVRPADTMTGIFDERIRSLQVRFDGDDFAMPVVVLNSPQRIRVSFDCL
ncbi:MAG: hypothetical protein K2K69_02750, partial [Muribaculaceae bacterium]|nr:hypothetical protein [Muribaculaceae bacterium]